MKSNFHNQALSNAWKAACAAAGTNTVLIPKDMYLLGPVVLGGPCKGTTIGFQIEGVVKAPEDPSVFKTDFWIEFLSINGLTISGGGTFDGQGQKAWANCANNPNCPQRPTVSFLKTLGNKCSVQDLVCLTVSYNQSRVYRIKTIKTVSNKNIYIYIGTHKNGVFRVKTIKKKRVHFLFKIGTKLKNASHVIMW